ncbi:hypothetical protein M430DRAFT_92960 [Amorphotheca resinae ATCC 22711]|uniref:Vacuolar segregation protein 7 n=1 Tax=Amorphotheca resinae ATCC 22711 TaxID=857342 RepID=A0A2T3BDD5_AMORE|nr:hypothetical protein M430DRAFT_92960 [Amorphotheca resinae ATCC 22711]PSS27419.1 hypothetical protein M430DRAFT_92960 [Amorphotheca resinae ATCC 22711]
MADKHAASTSTNSTTSAASVPDATQEPADSIDTATVAASNGNHPASTTPKPLRDPSAPSTPSTKRLQPKRTTSATNSPVPSRESSPARPSLKSNPSARSSGPGRSRKNSIHDVSPSRSASTSTSNPLSAAAQQRALSASTVPLLHPVPSDPNIQAPIPQKPSVAAELKDTPRWPVSPRLRSPPPTNKPAVLSPRKAEHDLPSINVQRSLQPSEQHEGKPAATADTEADDSLPTSGMRTPARGVGGNSSALETVQEISQPSTPVRGLDGAPEKGGNGASKLVTELDRKARASNESGSESGGKSEMRTKKTAALAPVSRPTAPTKSHSTTAAIGRGKPPGEGSTRNMTVETETVSSIPQVAVGGVAGGVGNNGSLRAKPSSETIRPKREKKKTARKTPSVTSGTASSKADIFEAKVASAVDEANSSDSEETFVYESNPPDASDRPRRFHSRTPSATSMASQADQRNGVRSIMDGGHSVAMKKSMKFANSYTSNPPETVAGEDDGKGTGRSAMGTGRGTAHHHHIGRWGRNGGNGHASLFDNESPFPNAAKSKFIGGTPRHSSRPTSPRVSNRWAANGKKSSPIAYDLDDGADDERTPLISTVRSSGRSGRRSRPVTSSMRQLEHQALRHNRSFLSRFAGCLVLSLMIILVISASIGFMFATTQPLAEVKILALKNVLASEQDVIFDMKVSAQNPNVAVVTIDSTDLVIFAKSKYAGTDAEWWKRPQDQDLLRRGNRRRDDDPLDPPIDEDPGTNPNLEIGHVYELDSPLMFEGSLFHHSRSESTGQIRITNPGNHTVPAGSERWGRVLQHEFDLIVRGTLKYTLPFSQKLRSISVEGRATVKPNAADQDPDTVHII